MKSGTMNFEEYRRILEACSDKSALLIAVSKTRSAAEILGLYHHGQRDFGENRVQEWLEKKDLLPDDIRWHLIGHIQTNKVKFLDPVPALIHSADRLSLLDALEKEGEKRGVVFKALLQVKIAREESKFGFEGEELVGLARSGKLSGYRHIAFHGLMGMATFTEDELQVKQEFAELRHYFEELLPLMDGTIFREISMGMSGDYTLALEEGSTMVRIGSSIFGERH